MARAKRGVKLRRRHKKWLKLAKGNNARRKNAFRVAKTTVERGLKYAYRDRRIKKREFRRLWIIRINAAVRTLGTTYGRFMAGLKKNNIEIDRKILADLAINDAAGLARIVELAKG